jgi:hypothetical protein
MINSINEKVNSLKSFSLDLPPSAIIALIELRYLPKNQIKDYQCEIYT